MNPNTIKISLIVLASVGATAGILGFFKTRVSPPTELAVTNVHQQSIDESMQKFDDSKGIAFNDSLYNTVADRIMLFSRENLIPQSSLQSNFWKLTDLYVPIFTSKCKSTFSTSGWGSANFSAYRARINELDKLKQSVGAGALSSGSSQMLNNVSDIMKRYEAARKLVNECSFRSVSEARSDIDAANAYLGDYHIGCSNLQNSLRSFPSSMESRHYAKVKRAVDELAHYYYISESDYNSKSGEAQRLINEYNNNKANLYGNAARDISNLNSAATQYVRQAKQYYEESRKSIKYSLGYNWTTTYSPRSGYIGFMSTNKGMHSTTATMSFTITGYSSFTCYVRSDGERCCDYLTISEPNSSSVRWSGANNGSSNSSASGYSAVTYYNLSPSSYYTITVKYQKDSYGDTSPDRGYLLLPDNARSY